jgi:tRNA threonylcarbamoyladenosine biosynthesis protein TsaE
MDKTYDLGEIHEVARFLDAQFSDKNVWALHGEMGAGKTTLVSALCSVWNVQGTVSSPTFSIINVYKTAGPDICHIDLYRCRDVSEVVNAGVEDVVYSGKRCLIEWPEKAEGLLPDDALHLYLTVIGANTRKITVDIP